MNQKNFKILFYPECPDPHSTIYKIVKTLRLEIINTLEEEYDLAIYWEDTTYRKSCPIPEKTGYPILNRQSTDISKKKINKEFKEVFGYSTFVNPVLFQGKCVRKSDQNATHDGEIIQCPIPTQEEEFIYQKLINNTDGEGKIYDIRTPVFNRSIPFVMIKYKNRPERFSDHYICSCIRETDTAFTPREIRQIHTFCEKIGLDYGELDILRDSDNKQIYILDANNTPWWSTSLHQADWKPALDRLAETFKKEFITRT